MNPVALLAVAAAAGGAYWLYENKFKKTELPGQAPGQLPGVVSKLTKGRSYAVTAVITKQITEDPRWAALGSMPNEEKIEQIISATFEQSGCKMLSKPVIRNEAEMKKAIAGEPSTWVFNMQWLMDADHIKTVIPWLAGATFVLLPIQ